MCWLIQTQFINYRLSPSLLHVFSSSLDQWANQGMFFSGNGRRARSVNRNICYRLSLKFVIFSFTFNPIPLSKLVKVPWKNCTVIRQRDEESRLIIQPTTSGFATNHPGTLSKSPNFSFSMIASIHLWHSTNNFIICSVSGIVLGDGNTTVNKLVRILAHVDLIF